MDEKNNTQSALSGRNLTLWGVLLVIVVAAVVIFVAARGNRAGEEAGQEQAEAELARSKALEDATNAINKGEVEGITVQSEVKTFNLDAQNFSFSPAEIRVKKGDTVKAVLNNVMGFHDWVVDEFNARTPQIQEGQVAEVEFVADKTGEFEYYCSVGNHRAMGMVGALTVE